METTGLAGQRETTCNEEKKKADADFEFSFCVFMLFLRVCPLVLSLLVHVW